MATCMMGRVYWEEEGLDEALCGGLLRSLVPSGGSLRARLRDSRVTPLPSFVMPTTGGSSFLTNSQRPKCSQCGCWQVMGRRPRLTRQLMPSQSECLPSNLLVQVSLQLKDNAAHRKPNSPVIEFTLTLTHTLLVTLGVDTDVGAHPLVELVVHPSQSSLDRLLCNLQSRSRHPTVVVLHAKPEVSPYHCCSAG